MSGLGPGSEKLDAMVHKAVKGSPEPLPYSSDVSAVKKAVNAFYEGGTNRPENLRLACWDCNHDRRDDCCFPRPLGSDLGSSA